MTRKVKERTAFVAVDGKGEIMIGTFEHDEDQARRWCNKPGEFVVEVRITPHAKKKGRANG